jgi:hypothetical protein
MGKPSAPRKPVSKRRRTAKVKGRTIESAIEAINAIEPPTPEAARVLALLKSWLADDSGYDEETWPQLKRALDEERDRVGARRLFDH